MESGHRALVRDMEVQDETQQGNVYMIKRQECRDRQEQEVRLILHREQGWDLITSEFEHGTEVSGISEVMWK